MILKSLPILAAAVALAAAGQAGAQRYYDEPPSVGEVVVTPPPYVAPGAELRHVPVFFDDLDLNTASGGYTLFNRIRAAAEQACAPDPSSTRDLNDRSDYNRCMRQAMFRAVDDVDAASVRDALDAYEYGG